MIIRKKHLRLSLLLLAALAAALAVLRLGGMLILPARGQSASGFSATELALTHNPPATPTPAPTLRPTATFSAPEATIPATWDPTDLPPLVITEESGSYEGGSGALDLPPGVYRVIFQIDGAFESLTPVVEEGACGEAPLFAAQEGPFEGSAAYRSTGCRVAFEVAGTRADWTLTVQTATYGEHLTPPVTISGEGPVASQLVDLPQNLYRLIIDTESPYTLVTPVVISGLCLERPIFVLGERGEFEEVYESTGCLIVLGVSTADGRGRWVLTIERQG